MSVEILAPPMPTEPTTDPKFEIGHILFIDIVGYSKLNIDEQSILLRELNRIVQGTEQFRRAELENKLLGELFYVVTVIRTVEMFEMIIRPRAVEKNRVVKSA